MIMCNMAYLGWRERGGENQKGKRKKKKKKILKILIKREEKKYGTSGETEVELN